MKVLDQHEGPDFQAYNADSVEWIQGLPSESVHLSVFSPPFASLYTYSASDRDMGNCRNHEEFHQHFSYLLAELLRVTKPGRIMAVHCMALPTSKSRDGVIGLIDFPGDLTRAAQAAGWIYHSQVTVWKDPVTAMQRTKALGLLHKQLLKDSTRSRMGLPDEVRFFRRPGDNAEPVERFNDPEWPQGPDERNTNSIEEWQRWASPVWSDIDQSDTLQYMSAREHEDERHICPLQLGVIERCIRLYSNPGDVVLSPFMGIGSEGYVALQKGRKFIGCELKQSYYQQAVRNLNQAARQLSLAV